VPVIDELKRELYNGDGPYLSARLKYVDLGYPHTNIRPELIESVLRTLHPGFWLEIGSMLGGSAIRTAETIKRMSLPTEVVCIDPFCGDVNMWAWEKGLAAQGQWRFLRVEDCRPTIYERFLANILRSGHSDIILPLTMTSTVGIKLLRRLVAEQRLSALPEVVYLDSAHEPDETLLELLLAWDLLPPGGVLMGDDWDWDTVRNDVRKFGNHIRANEATLRGLAAQHADASIENNVLLYRGQWLLAK